MARLATGRASRTARITAAIRYRHFLGGAEPRVVLDREAGLFLDWRTLAMAAPTPLSDLAFGRVLGPFRGIEGEVLARARYVDDRLAEAFAAGLRQLVVLGAGFDTVAQRFAGRGLNIFEVDHPATQREKRAILARHPKVRHEATFVPVDFARDSLAAALDQAGLDRARPALVSWLGVTMYLDQAVTVGTLAAIRPLLADGSMVIFDAFPGQADVTPDERPLFAAMRAFTRMRGEPMIGEFDLPAFLRDLPGAGYRLAETLTGDDMRDRWFAAQPRAIHPPRSALILRLETD